MKIGLVIERLDPNLGGAEQWTYRYANWLVQERHDVHLIARCFHKCVRQMRATAHELAPTSSRIEFATAAERKAKSLALDVVHDMGRGWYCDIFQPHNGSWTAHSHHKLRTEPTWRRSLARALQHVLPRYREFDRLMARQYVADERLFIALANRVAGHFETFHGVAPRQIRRIYNGVDTERFSPEACGQMRASTRRQLGVRSNEVMLLFVAHNFILKGLPTLLRSLIPLHRQDHPVRLVVVGGKRIGGYERMARRLGLLDKVSMIGSIEDTAPYYGAADAFVLPTYYDPCSLVVLEALASGLPVITSQYNGVAELMTDGVEGFVVRDPGNADELTGHLERLLDAELRREMGMAARRLAEAHSLVDNFKRIVEVYDEVLRRKQRAAA